MTDLPGPLLRTLRDIHTGHIGLYATVQRFDTQTGQRLSQPRIMGVGPDRAPCHGTPNARGDWWAPLLRDGWLELREGAGRDFLLTTDKTVTALRVAGLIC